MNARTSYYGGLWTHMQRLPASAARRVCSKRMSRCAPDKASHVGVAELVAMLVATLVYWMNENVFGDRG
jgi:hypothetical protein